MSLTLELLCIPRYRISMNFAASFQFGLDICYWYKFIDLSDNMFLRTSNNIVLFYAILQFLIVRILFYSCHHSKEHWLFVNTYIKIIQKVCQLKYSIWIWHNVLVNYIVEQARSCKKIVIELVFMLHIILPHRKHVLTWHSFLHNVLYQVIVFRLDIIELDYKCSAVRAELKIVYYLPAVWIDDQILS